MYKPDGYGAVSPYLIVADAEAVIGFLEAVFGAELVFAHRDGDGVIRHAEIRLDDGIVMLGQVDGTPEGAGAQVHVYVPDVDAAFDRARAAGGAAVQEPAEKGDGDRRGGVRDPGGTTWWISTQVDAGARAAMGGA